MACDGETLANLVELIPSIYDFNEKWSIAIQLFKTSYRKKLVMLMVISILLMLR